MSKMIRHVERQIARRFINDAHKAGYCVGIAVAGDTVFPCDEPIPLKMLLDKMFEYDEVHLTLRRGDEYGWVLLIFGGDGWDVVNDYTTNLTELMEGAEKLSDKYN